MENENVIEMPGPNGEIITWHQGSLREQFQVMTSLPQDSPEHRAVIMDLLERVEMDKDSLVNEVLELSEFIAHPVLYRSAGDGGLTPGVRIVFPIEGRGILAGVGRPLLESVQRLAWASGRTPPWYPPVKAKLVQRATREGGRTYKLTYVSG